jgi:hypothetical protein
VSFIATFSDEQFPSLTFDVPSSRAAPMATIAQRVKSVPPFKVVVATMLVPSFLSALVAALSQSISSTY